MTCTHNFWWRHMYVHPTIASGKDILGPEGPYISFPYNFTKKYFFSNFWLVSDSDRRDLSKEPIKSWGFCKSALDLNCSSRSVPYHKVYYTSTILVPTGDQYPTVHLTQISWIAVAPKMLVANQIWSHLAKPWEPSINPVLFLFLLHIIWKIIMTHHSLPSYFCVF